MTSISFGDQNQGLQLGISHGPIYYTSGELLIAYKLGPGQNQGLIVAFRPRATGTPPRATVDRAVSA
jgi:hypothetical protein